MDLMILLKSLYFILPAYFANMAPVAFKNVNFLATPVDFGKKLGKNPVFGAHKTWRGMVAATLAGILIFYIQKILYQYIFFAKISLIDYSSYSIFLGALIGFGAIFGDLVKSFFKRRLSIKPGKRWIPFDQLDFVIGALAFASFYYIAPLTVWIILIIVTIPLHMAANHIAFYLGISKQKW